MVGICNTDKPADNDENNNSIINGRTNNRSVNSTDTQKIHEVIEVARRTGRPLNQVINGLSMLGMTGGAFCMVGVASFALGPVGMAIAGAVVGAGLIGYLSTTCLEDIFFNKKLDRVNYAGIPHPGYLIEDFRNQKLTYNDGSDSNDTFSTSVWLRDKCYIEQIFWVHPLKDHKEVHVADKLTVSSCLLACGKLGYRYAGLLDASKCYCADHRNPDLRNVRQSNDCTKACPGFAGEKCGGNKAMDVYENQGHCQLKHEGCFAKPDNKRRQQKQEKKNVDNAFKLQFSFKQPSHVMTLEDMISTTNYAHLEFELKQLTRVDYFCIQACLYRGYAYSAISGNKCYCSFENNWSETKSEHCSTPCDGADDDAKCGGPNGFRTVYSCKYQIPDDFEEQVKTLLESKKNHTAEH